MDCHGGLASGGQSGGEADAARPLLLPGPSVNNDQMVLRNPPGSVFLRERRHFQVVITSKKRIFDSKMPSHETPMPAHLIAEEDISKDKEICLKL